MHVPPIHSAHHSRRFPIFSGLAIFALGAAAGAQVTVLNTPNRTEGGYFGASVAGLSDINGDGLGDVAVGAPGEWAAGQTSARGRVYLHSGQNGSIIRSLYSPNHRPDGRFGASVAGVPDADGDGVMDVLVGAPGEGFQAQVGRAYLFSGASGALLRVLHSPAQQTYGFFGASVAGVPDVDGDGRGDLIIGAPDERSGGAPPGAGRVHVFSGRTGTLIHTLRSRMETYGGSFGESVAGVPDANGDGRGDILVGAPKESPGGTLRSGNAYLFSGATGEVYQRFVSPGREAGGCYGESVSGIPDVDGDGRGDLVMGAPGEDPGNSPADCGRAYVYSGATGSLLWRLLPPVAEEGGNFGGRVAGMGDTTGDGRGDIIVGAWRESPGTTPEHSGRIHVYSGRTGGRYKTFPSGIQTPGGLFGFAVAGVPDTNNGGNYDLVISAIGESPNTTTAAYAGRVYIIR